jgi:MFS superfamily sulfate permease-like transporter
MQDAKSKHPHMGLSRWIPALRWLPVYDRSWLRVDFVAGLTLAAYLLPAGCISR